MMQLSPFDFRKRRPLSLKAAAKISSALGLNASETARLYEMIEVEKRSSVEENPSAPIPFVSQRQVDEDTFHLISEWQHFAILNLIDCEGFKWNATYIAKRLGLSPIRAQMAMNLLLRVGLVKKTDGRFQGVRDHVLSLSGTPSQAIRNYHKQILEKAAMAIETQSIDEREISGVGFAIDPKRLPQIKRELSDFQDRFVAKYSVGKKHEVYFLESVLFRITQGGSDENN